MYVTYHILSPNFVELISHNFEDQFSVIYRFYFLLFNNKGLVTFFVFLSILVFFFKKNSSILKKYDCLLIRSSEIRCFYTVILKRSVLPFSKPPDSRGHSSDCSQHQVYICSGKLCIFRENKQTESGSD